MHRLNLIMWFSQTTQFVTEPNTDFFMSTDKKQKWNLCQTRHANYYIHFIYPLTQNGDRINVSDYFTEQTMQCLM